MVYNGVIEKKLLKLETYLLELEEWNITSLFLFKKSSMENRAVERSLTVCVEILIDVAARILAINKIPPETKNLGKIEQIEQIGVIKSAKYYSDMIKFRNMVVHRYENIDPIILFDIITNRLDDYRKFIDEVRKYCKTDKN